MSVLVTRASAAVAGFFRRYPWIGWAGWTVFVVAVLIRTHPRRFGTAFGAYLDAAHRLWAGQEVYDPQKLGDFLYLPIALLILGPLTPLSQTAAAAIVTAIYAVVFSWAAVALVRAASGEGARRDATMVAGLLLLINIPAAWYNFKYVQSQVIMTAGMMLAAAAIIRQRWLQASAWLCIAMAMKPLAIVMVLLCGALVPRMRLLLIAAFVLVLVLPFVFIPAPYLVEQYQAYGQKLWHIATAPPQEWIYQADFTTLLKALGLVLPGSVSVAVRLAAALATLWLAWRVCTARDWRAFGLAVLLLSGCYINLFTPRNEHISFLAVTPALTILALILLGRDPGDRRGWLLVAASLAVGFWWTLAIDSVLKPAIIVIVYVWAGWQMARLDRWRALVDLPRPSNP